MSPSERGAAVVGPMPAPLRYGVALFATAAAGDVAAHVVPAAAGLQQEAHLATAVGMVLTLAGVISTGLHRSQQHHNRR